MPDLYPASLNGIPLAIETIHDGFSKAIARYEFPYKDGAELEDMGQRARVVHIRCYFWDAPNSLTPYNLHIDLLNSLANQTLFELVHPEYGPIMGCIDAVSVTQDERQRTAEVEIYFVENLRGPTQVMQNYPAQDVLSDCEDAFSTSILESIAAFGAEATAVLGAEASTVVSFAINTAAAIPGQFSGLSMNALSFVEAVSSGVTALNAVLPGVTNPANSVLAAIQFPRTLPGLAVQAAAKACERYMILRQPLTSQPTSFTSTLASDFSALPAAISQAGNLAGGTAAPAAIRVSTVTLPKIINAQAASACALALAQVYANDQANWTTVEQSQAQNSFDALGRYIYPDTASTPLMTVGDLEQTLSDVRTQIQGAIDFMRANDVPPSSVASGIEGAGSTMSGLKQAALALQTQVESEMLARETVVEVAIPNPMPLHLICLMVGLPYNAAEQLWAINRGIMQNPNAVSGPVYVYQAPGVTIANAYTPAPQSTTAVPAGLGSQPMGEGGFGD